jgi:hypothetical protein
MANTADQGIRYPVAADDPDVPTDMLNAITDIEKKLVRTYTSATDRNSKNASPTEGQVAYLLDVNTLTYYTGSAWANMFPPTIPAFTSGTAVPANSVGANGDVFFKV